MDNITLALNYAVNYDFESNWGKKSPTWPMRKQKAIGGLNYFFKNAANDPNLTAR